MADIDIRRSHNLGLKVARDAAEHMAADLDKKFGLSGGWTGNTMHFDRPGVRGSLALTDKDLHLTVSLGFLLKALRTSIERAVHEELDTLFATRAKHSATGHGHGTAKPRSKSKTGTGARNKGD